MRCWPRSPPRLWSTTTTESSPTPTPIRAWVAAEIIGDRVTMEVTEATERSGITVLRARYDGDYDKTNLPDELILTNYVIIRDDLITALFIIFNTPDA